MNNEFKFCKCCGKSISAAEWAQLHLVGHQVDEWEDIELRDCLCKSTLAVVVQTFKIYNEAA